MRGFRLRRRGVAAVVCAAGLLTGCTSGEPAPGASPSAEASGAHHYVKQPEQITWLTPQPPADFLPDGVLLALVEGGSPLVPGPFTFRLKFPPGSRLMPHTHPATERITVLSGVMHQGIGARFDQSSTEAIPTGGFVYREPGIPHYVWFDQETVIQFHGTGPFGLTYLDSADDPRTQRG
ncbi:MAG: cupin domain-containing protein [Actinomycetota bacterium]